MNLRATIYLEPSFDAPHLWKVELVEGSNGTVGRIYVECAPIAQEEIRGVYELSEADIETIPRRVRTGVFREEGKVLLGLDGISVDFEIETDQSKVSLALWCPDRAEFPEYVDLLGWCRACIHRRCEPEYQYRLGELDGYSLDWRGFITPIRGGVKISGQISTGHALELMDVFNNLVQVSAPVIDLQKCEGVQPSLYALFELYSRYLREPNWQIKDNLRDVFLEKGIFDEDEQGGSNTFAKSYTDDAGLEHVRSRLSSNLILPVVGTAYDGREKIIQKRCYVGQKVELIREPNNRHDSNAIAVYLNPVDQDDFRDFKIGYISRKHASWMAEELDCAVPIIAIVHSFYIPPYRDRVPEVNLELVHLEE